MIKCIAKTIIYKVFPQHRHFIERIIWDILAHRLWYFHEIELQPHCKTPKHKQNKFDLLQKGENNVKHTKIEWTTFAAFAQAQAMIW